MGTEKDSASADDGSNAPNMKTLNDRMKLVRKKKWWPFALITPAVDATTGEKIPMKLKGAVDTREMGLFQKICNACARPGSLTADAATLQMEYAIDGPMDVRRFLYIMNVFRMRPAPAPAAPAETGGSAANVKTDNDGPAATIANPAASTTDSVKIASSEPESIKTHPTSTTNI